MKIALINSEYCSASGSGQGGIATYTYTMAQGLRSLGHTVHVLVRKGIDPVKLPQDVNPVFYEFTSEMSLIKKIAHRLKPDPLQWEKGHSHCLRNYLVNLHKEGNLDIAEIPEYAGMAYSCTPPLPFPIVVNFHMPTSLVDNINGTIPDKGRLHYYNFEEAAIKKATAYRSPSIAMKNEACSRYKIPPDRITVIANPVSTVPFDAVIKQHTGDFRFHILFIGRLERRKGAELLLKTIKEILRIDDRIHFTIAGETEMHDAAEYRQAIERTLNQEQRQRVWFLGAIDRKDLFILYCRSSLLLAPSLFENAPYSILEAMAAHLPVITSSEGGIPEIISHNKTGLLFNTSNPSSMTYCIRTLFNSPELCIELAKNAYDHVTRVFSPRAISEQTISFYESIIHK